MQVQTSLTKTTYLCQSFALYLNRNHILGPQRWNGRGREGPLFLYNDNMNKLFSLSLYFLKYLLIYRFTYLSVYLFWVLIE